MNAVWIEACPVMEGKMGANDLQWIDGGWGEDEVMSEFDQIRDEAPLNKAEVGEEMEPEMRVFKTAE